MFGAASKKILSWVAICLISEKGTQSRALEDDRSNLVALEGRYPWRCQYPYPGPSPYKVCAVNLSHSPVLTLQTDSCGFQAFNLTVVGWHLAPLLTSVSSLLPRAKDPPQLAHCPLSGHPDVPKKSTTKARQVSPSVPVCCPVIQWYNVSELGGPI